MIKWYYANQSQQARKQMLNRLYIVCDGKDAYECLIMKSDFTILREIISAFMNYCIHSGVNNIEIIDEPNKYSLKSDIIYISYK